MTVSELVSRFPEIPADLHAEPVLEIFAQKFDAYLPTATKPSACSTDRTASNQAYMTLVAPMDIYRYGLSTQERVIEQLSELIRDLDTSVEAFEDRMFATLVFNAFEGIFESRVDEFWAIVDSYKPAVAATDSRSQSSRSRPE